MGLKTLVKVGEVTNLSDARYCAGMGVELIGFNLDKSGENYVSLETFTAITGWIEGVHYVAEFENSTLEEITETLTNYEVAFLQVSTTELVDALMVTHPDKKIILKLETEANDFHQTIEAYSDKVSYILVESTKDTLPEIKTPGAPILLGSGVTAESLEHVLSAINPTGIALKGSPEIRPGYKNFDELADILEALETEGYE